jgi:hypothetical protein
MIEFPTIGSVWTDSTGRTLRVDDVQPKSRLGRHVVGCLLLGNRTEPYACDLPTFELVWRERKVCEAGGEFLTTRQAYADGLPVRRSKR